jgi:DinB family protein
MTAEELHTLIEELRRTPARAEALMARIPGEKQTERPRPDAFSARENIHHLRDVEAEGYSVRLLRLLDEKEPELKDLEGANLARERQYNERPHDSALKELSRLRAANVERLLRLTPEDLARTGSWENVGPVTLGRVLEMWRDHDRGHLDELAWVAGELAAEPRHNF